MPSDIKIPCPDCGKVHVYDLAVVVNTKQVIKGNDLETIQTSWVESVELKE